MGVRPAAEVEITETLVAGLLSEQHPDLADAEIRIVAEGWDTVVARLGAELAVRLPRRAVAAPLLRTEQRWLPRLAPQLDVPTPVPVRLGRPSRSFPWPWTVVPWLDGDLAADQAVCVRTTWAAQLAAVVLRLHRRAPVCAPVNPVRGVPLRRRDAVVRARLRHLPDPEPLERLWARLAAVPGAARRRTWIHGDLHPGNIVVQGERVTGLLDFGDLAAGDPATDLATAWLTFDVRGRAVFRAALGSHVDGATWQRGRGWGLVLASAILVHADDDPVLGPVGRHGLAAVLRG
jgi:aminoglycoside phosphotransferase (APT) family kinase protein